MHDAGRYVQPLHSLMAPIQNISAMKWLDKIPVTSIIAVNYGTPNTVL